MKNKLIWKVIDFYFYSSIHIALSAICFICQTYILLNKQINYSYIVFIFSSTLFLYLLHNILGLNTLLTECVRDKIKKFREMKTGLVLMIVIFGTISIFSFFRLSVEIILSISGFAFISIWYVVPVFGGKKRLRDFPIIKIFLIALVWSSISTFIPLINSDIPISTQVLIFIEKYLYIFAITLPFDIRDIKFDKIKNLRTIPIIIGKSKSIAISILSLTISILIVLYLSSNSIYPEYRSYALTIGYLITLIIVIFSKNKTNDYYFTGLLDGMAIIICLLILSALLLF